MILVKINKPNDIKKLDPIEYNQIAYEIRQFLNENISKKQNKHIKEININDYIRKIMKLIVKIKYEI